MIIIIYTLLLASMYEHCSLGSECHICSILGLYKNQIIFLRKLKINWIGKSDKVEKRKIKENSRKRKRKLDESFLFSFPSGLFYDGS